MGAGSSGPRPRWGRGEAAQAYGAAGRAGWLGRWRREPWPPPRSGPGVSGERGPGSGPGHERAALASPSRGARPRTSPWRGSRTTSCWWRSGRTRAVSAGPAAEGCGRRAGAGRPGRVSRGGGRRALGQSRGHVRRAGRGRRASAGVVRGTCRAGVPGRGSGRGGLPEDSRAARDGEPNLPTTLGTEPGQAELWRGPGRWEGPDSLGLPAPGWVGRAVCALADCRGLCLQGHGSFGCQPLLGPPVPLVWSPSVWGVSGPGGLARCSGGGGCKDCEEAVLGL